MGYIYFRLLITEVIHQENRGLSAARNVELDLMTGDYVSFLDSDDAYMPKMIEKMISKLNGADADLIECGYKTYKTEGELKKATRENSIFTFDREELLSSKEALNRLLTGRINICVWDKLYKTNLWESLRFPESTVHEDLYVTPQILERCSNILTISEMGVFHRMRKGSITATHTEKNIRDGTIATNHLFEYVEKRTPELFSVENTRVFLENTARRMTIWYARVRSEEPDVAEILRAEAIRYWHLWDDNARSIKLKVALFLLRNYKIITWLKIPFHIKSIRDKFLASL